MERVYKHNAQCGCVQHCDRKRDDCDRACSRSDGDCKRSGSSETQIRDYILIKGFMLNQKSVARREYACNTLFTMKEKIQNPGKDSFCR